MNVRDLVRFKLTLAACALALVSLISGDANAAKDEDLVCNPNTYGVHYSIRNIPTPTCYAWTCTPNSNSPMGGYVIPTPVDMSKCSTDGSVVHVPAPATSSVVAPTAPQTPSGPSSIPANPPIPSSPSIPN